MTVELLGALVGLFVSGLLVGHELGRRAVWKRLQRRPAERERALERLAVMHGAKVTIFDPGAGG